MVIKSSQQKPSFHEEHDQEEDLTDDETEKSKGSILADILQKPFDFISMMVQFIIYFMVRMATEGCMLPIPELEDHENEVKDDDDDDDDEGGSGSGKKDE